MRYWKMEPEKQNYIEETGLTFEKLGMTRMAGRVMGYLMTCDKDVASFEEIREAILASKGSISGTLKQLAQIDLVKAVSLPGDRKTYYQISKTPMTDWARSKLDMYLLFSETLHKGRLLKNREDDVSEWLLEASLFYKWIGQRMDDIISNWEEQKAEIIQKEQTKNKH